MTSTRDVEDSAQLNVVDIQRYCVHDGPGIRTTVFLQGCSMRCKWCHNPESQALGPQLMFSPHKCPSPEFCAPRSVKACERQALKVNDMDGSLSIDWEKCNQCLKCVESCPHGALQPVSKMMSLQEVFNDVVKDMNFFTATGGGVTLSGGEPLMQCAGAAGFLKLCKDAKIHTVVETAGGVPWSAFSAVLPFVDEWLFDVKAINADCHSDIIGFSASTVQENIFRLVDTSAVIHFRMPVIPRANAQCAAEIGQFLQSLGVKTVTLLKYNSLGDAKLEKLKLQRQSLGISESEAVESIEAADRTLKSMGFDVIRFDNQPSHELPTFSNRVLKLRSAVQSAPFSACIERSNLLTDFMKLHDGGNEERILTRAKGFSYVLQHKKAVIYDSELIVGNFTSKRVGGHIYMDLHGFTFFDAAFLDTRAVNPLQFSREEKWTFYTKLLPYWLSRNALIHSFPLSAFPSMMLENFCGNTYITPIGAGVNHFIPNMKLLLDLGTDGIIERSKKHGDSPFQRALQVSCEGLNHVAAAFAHTARTMAEIEKDPVRSSELRVIAEICTKVPKRPASTFHEALQSLVFGMIGLSVETGGESFGRIDQLLYPTYQADIAAGRLTPEKALELVGCFTVKLGEIAPVIPTSLTGHFSGMYTQLAVDIGGVHPETGECACNDVTHMFLDATTLKMREPNYHARVSSKNKPEYIQHIAKVFCCGTPNPSIFNDDVIIPLVEKTHNAPRHVARDYGVVGCVEVAMQGNHFGDTDWALINVAKPMSDLLADLAQPSVLQTVFTFLWFVFHALWSFLRSLFLNGEVDPSKCLSRTEPSPVSTIVTMKDVLTLYQHKMNAMIDQVMLKVQPLELGLRHFPIPLADALMDGCMEKELDLNAGGARYNSSGVQGVGIADVADSLAVIDELVFKKKVCTLPQLVDAVQSNFKNDPGLLGLCRNVPKFGNDNALPDKYAQVVMDCFATALKRHKNTRGGGPYVPGHYAMTTHTVYGKRTGALPSGRLAGQPFANGLSATTGNERLGPTATLNSVAGLRPVPNGSVTNVMFDIALLKGLVGINVMQGVIRGFCSKGGLEMQLNILDKDVLIEAMKNPEKYRDLLVRVSGYCSYFNDLTPEMKQLLINRQCANR